MNINILKRYKETVYKKCPICHKEVTIEHIQNYDFVYTKTKRKSNVFAHKSCLVKKGAL